MLARVFADDPLVLVDVGCALGIDPVWRQFAPDLVAVGIDPQLAECERLNGEETDPRVHYRPGLVGVPATHPLRQSAETLDERMAAYHEPFERTSAAYALATDATSSRTPETRATETWRDQILATEQLTLAELADSEGLTYVDFIKSDTDGNDLDVVVSAEPVLRERGVLGLVVEVPFTGSDAASSSSFHNIDRFLKGLGFHLFGLTINRYSRVALPAPFVYRAPYQTVRGQPIWGDALYLRDAGSPDYEAVWRESPSPTKLLKLASLLELFDLSDCAAELLLRHREIITERADVEALLDLLTPPLDGRRVKYREYRALFDSDIDCFYPAPNG